MARSHKFKEPTTEELILETAKYSSRSEFALENPKLYRYARSKGLIDHLPDLRLKWTNETLVQEALRFTTRSEFRAKSNKAYQTAQVRGLLDQVCQHMSLKNAKNS